MVLGVHISAIRPVPVRQRPDKSGDGRTGAALEHPGAESNLTGFIPFQR